VVVVAGLSRGASAGPRNKTAVFTTALLLALTITGGAAGKPRSWRKPKEPPPEPPPALSSLPSVLEASRVDVRLAPVGALVTSDWLLEKGEWTGTSFDVFVAYTAPGLPVAFEALLLPEPADGVLPLLATAGQSLTTHHAPSAPSQTAFSIGRPNLAGQVVRVEDKLLVEAFEGSSRAFLRLRTVVRFEGGTRFVPSVVVRLETPRLGPVPVGAVTVHGERGFSVASAQASFCDLDGGLIPLRLAQSIDTDADAPKLAPFLQKLPPRHDLCVAVRAPTTEPPPPPPH
jgi:hypothetical protein